MSQTCLHCGGLGFRLVGMSGAKMTCSCQQIVCQSIKIPELTTNNIVFTKPTTCPICENGVVNSDHSCQKDYYDKLTAITTTSSELTLDYTSNGEPSVEIPITLLFDLYAAVSITRKDLAEEIKKVIKG